MRNKSFTFIKKNLSIKTFDIFSPSEFKELTVARRMKDRTGSIFVCYNLMMYSYIHRYIKPSNITSYNSSSELLVRRSYPHMMDSLKGQWVRDSADNYDKLLKELAVNWLLRTAAQASTPVMEITEEDGEWSIKSSTTLKTVELKFKVKLIKTH